MSEINSAKQDERFRHFLLYVLKGITFVAYAGIVGVLVFAGWAWKIGWKEMHEMLWPIIGICILCAGSIWGSKLLRKLLV